MEFKDLVYRSKKKIDLWFHPLRGNHFTAEEIAPQRGRGTHPKVGSRGNQDLNLGPLRFQRDMRYLSLYQGELSPCNCHPLFLVLPVRLTQTTNLDMGRWERELRKTSWRR